MKCYSSNSTFHNTYSISQTVSTVVCYHYNPPMVNPPGTYLKGVLLENDTELFSIGDLVRHRYYIKPYGIIKQVHDNDFEIEWLDVEDAKISLRGRWHSAWLELVGD